MCDITSMERTEEQNRFCSLEDFTNKRELQGAAVHSVRNLGWVDHGLRCSTSLLIVQHVQPKQNQADGGAAKIKVKPTQLSD